MGISGHKTRDMFKRYDTINDEDLLAAVGRGSGKLAIELAIDRNPKTDKTP